MGLFKGIKKAIGGIAKAVTKPLDIVKKLLNPMQLLQKASGLGLNAALANIPGAPILKSILGG